MTGPLHALVTWPTIAFTVPLALAIAYWILALATGLDVEAGADSLEGAIESVLEGGAESFSEAAAEGCAAGALEGALDDGAGLNWLAANGCLGLAVVPVTLVASVFVLIGWIACYSLSRLSMAVLGNWASSGWFGLLTLFSASVIGLAGTSLAVRPLRPLFRSDDLPARQDLVGWFCTISTLRVDERFGQAEVDDGAAGLIVQVRCREANELSRGDRALIFGFSPGEQTYEVIPIDAVMGSRWASLTDDA
jgi:hypothetical protein